MHKHSYECIVRFRRSAVKARPIAIFACVATFAGLASAKLSTGERTMLLPTTLCLAAAAAIINFWLGNRIGRLRQQFKVSIGDGGNELIARRMRAQLNFAENVPLVLILIAAIELAGKGGVWLAPVGAVFMVGRVLHALGMDGGQFAWGRMAGIAITFLTAIGLAVVAVLVATGKL